MAVSRPWVEDMRWTNGAIWGACLLLIILSAGGCSEQEIIRTGQDTPQMTIAKVARCVSERDRDGFIACFSDEAISAGLPQAMFEYYPTALRFLRALEERLGPDYQTIYEEIESEGSFWPDIAPEVSRSDVHPVVLSETKAVIIDEDGMEQFLQKIDDGWVLTFTETDATFMMRMYKASVPAMEDAIRDISAGREIGPIKESLAKTMFRGIGFGR